MIVKKHRELVVRMGEYESHRILGEVSVDTNNEYDLALIREVTSFNEKAELHVDVASFLDTALDEVMYSDVEDAHMNTADPDSFIHEFYASRTKER